MEYSLFCSDSQPEQNMPAYFVGTYFREHRYGVSNSHFQVPILRGVPLPVWTNRDCDAAYFQVPQPSIRGREILFCKTRSLCSRSLKYSCVPDMLTAAGTLVRLVSHLICFLYAPSFPPNISLLPCCLPHKCQPFPCCHTVDHRERKGGCRYLFICRPL